MQVTEVVQSQSDNTGIVAPYPFVPFIFSLFTVIIIVHCICWIKLTQYEVDVNESFYMNF